MNQELGKTKKKIGILGGTFNPIHNGHLSLAKAAIKKGNLDEVVFMPSGNSYMKQASEIVEAKHRFHMIECAISGCSKFSVSDIEIKRQGESYTYETMMRLQEKYPDNEYYFIMGADCLFSIEKWKKPDKIFQNCSILAVIRNGINIEMMEEQCNYLSNKYHGNVSLLPFEEIDISSTEIRNRINCNKSIEDIVPKQVCEYIRENDLYHIIKR